MGDTLQPFTVYLTAEEINTLNAEADEEGRSGASAQIRYVLTQRRRELRERQLTNEGQVRAES